MASKRGHQDCHCLTCVVVRLGFEVLGLPYETFASWRVWASRFWDCLAGLLRRGASGLRGHGAALRDFCAATGLGFEVSGLPCEIFTPWRVWASGFWGCLTRLLRCGASGLRGFGAALRDFCAVARLGFEVSGLPYRTFALWCVWASRSWGCLTRLLRRDWFGLRGFGATLQDFCALVRLGFEVLGLPYETFASRLVWASRFRGYLTRLLCRGASGLRGFGPALQDFCVVWAQGATARNGAGPRGFVTGLHGFGTGLRGSGAGLRGVRNAPPPVTAGVRGFGPQTSKPNCLNYKNAIKREEMSKKDPR